jgi:AcrR family transcriptional regulator
MGRHKTISDEDILAAARRVFLEKSHAASTREIATVAGVSEAILYQRFKSKDALFFAAMLGAGPDLTALLGPAEPPADAHAYVWDVVERLVDYFAGSVPAWTQVMMHPSFDPALVATSEAMTAVQDLTHEFAERLRRLHARKRIAATAFPAAAGVLTSLAHDWALHATLLGRGAHLERKHLRAMVDVVWQGLAPAPRRRDSK